MLRRLILVQAVNAWDQDQDPPSFKLDQTKLTQFAKDARKVFLRLVEAGGNQPFIYVKFENRIFVIEPAFRQIMHQVSDDALLP